MSSASAIVFALAASAHGQAAGDPRAGAQAGPGAACELHVWPAPGLNSVTQGWIKNDAVDRRLRNAGDQVPLGPELLSAARQAEYLQSLPIAQALGLNSASVTVHAEPLDRHVTRAEQGRHTGSVAACYTEVIVVSVHYASAPMFGPSLKTMVYLRSFDGGSQTPVGFLNTTDTPLRQYSPNDAQSGTSADADMVSAYKQDIAAFLANAVAWRQRRAGTAH